MTTIENEAGLTTGEKHALRLGIQVQTTESRGTAERLAEQADGEDPSWADTVRIAADAAAARRAESYARFVEQESVRNRPRVDPQTAAKPSGTTRGKVARAYAAEAAADRAEEDAAAAEYRRAEAESRRAQPSYRGGPLRKPALWEQAQIREQLARATGADTSRP